MTRDIKGPHVAAAAVVAIIALAALVAVSRAQAQGAAQPSPPRIQVTVTQLRPEMVTTWEDLQRNDMIPAQKKAGLPWRHTLGNGASGQSFTRVTIVPIASYAALDMPGFIQRAVSAEANANYNAKLRQTIDSQHVWIETLQPDLSIQSNSTAPPALLVVQDAQLLPGKGDAFAASMREDYLPAYKKAGVKDYWVFTVNGGGPGGGRVLVRPIAKYADLDRQGLLAQAGLSQEQQDKIGERRNATLGQGITTNVYRFIPELSYGTPAPVRSTN